LPSPQESNSKKNGSDQAHTGVEEKKLDLETKSKKYIYIYLYICEKKRKKKKEKKVKKKQSTQKNGHPVAFFRSFPCFCLLVCLCVDGIRKNPRKK
jgi:hypothetical protein